MNICFFFLLPSFDRVARAFRLFENWGLGIDSTLNDAYHAMIDELLGWAFGQR